MAETQAATRLREYETIFLVKPDLTDDNVDKLKERVRGIVGREGGKLIRFTVWGKKKTLFPVAKQPRAIYVHASYLGSSKLVAEVERNLRNFDEVSRYISVKVAEEVDPETRPVLEDLKLAGDVEETRPGAPAEREGGGFRGGGDEAGVESEEESTEEA
ncbi:30S ribosomal protein S6 [Pyxidicoccus parkwayensis]|uniref:Small ribosomal subunit protein bS6 n=1 Tax=Pyxidicoccus parkwayensis TaxID=2813578 RepID=A0ABX7P0N4_9BACT|nr:30S ribosomal protein S6 [Pyxidicoccus parkwaysis]QSQ24558.1 30S ribosomal protein S6 [Pyxidicoccus parkwaysis]